MRAIRALFRAIRDRIVRPAPPIAPGEDVVFLDVRSGPEFAAGHARGAIHLPVTRVRDHAHELEPFRDRRILVYCMTGHRAGSAVRALRDRGFTRVENAGGLGGLRRAGVEIER